MREQGIAPAIPANPAPYLSEWLLDVGPTAGEGPIEYRDLAAWQQVTGVELMPWEARLLRRLSGDYLAEKHRARKPDAPAPYSGTREDVVSNRERVSAQIKAAFKGLLKKS